MHVVEQEHGTPALLCDGSHQPDDTFECEEAELGRIELGAVVGRRPLREHDRDAAVERREGLADRMTPEPRPERVG